MLNILESLISRLESGSPAVSTGILRKTGSAPRGAGARMLVFPDGSTQGTIGGGLVEKETTDLGTAHYDKGGVTVAKFGLSQEEAASLDMICGGKVDVLVERIDPGTDTLRLFRRMADALRSGERCVLCTALEPSNGLPERIVLHAGETLTQGGTLPEAGLREAAELSRSGRPHVAEIAGASYFIEPSMSSGTLFLFGAGHVSRCTAELASFVGFRTVIIDDREEFANPTRFPKADDIRVVSSFEDCMPQMGIGPDAYIVIVTRGHMSDGDVLEQALATDAAYIGMIGSKSKRKALYASLRDKGFSEETIARIHSPIGLAIGAETPEEIAVSIVGELVQSRASR